MLDTFGMSIWHGSAGRMKASHRHAEIELNFIETGSLTYLFGGRQILFPAKRLTMFWAAAPHQVIQLEPNTTGYWATIPLAGFLQWELPVRFTQQVLQGRTIWESSETAGLPDELLFKRWCEDWKRNSPEYRKIALLEMQARLYRLAMSNVADRAELQNPHEIGRMSNKVEQIAAFIAERYTEPLSVATIAGAVHLHPKYAIALFHKTFGLSIMEYVTQYRLSHAQRLLATTEMKVLEVGLASGFGSASRFYQVFKDSCGQTPHGYRASLKLPALTK